MTSSFASYVVALAVDGTVSADALQSTANTLHEFGIAALVASDFADHEEPDSIVRLAEAQGWRAVVIASSDGKLPGKIARAVSIPVIRVPFADDSRSGLALLYDADGNLPAAPHPEATFATVAIGPGGAKNAALFVVSLLALDDERLRCAWEGFRAAQTDAVLRQPAPSLA